MFRRISKLSFVATAPRMYGTLKPLVLKQNVVAFYGLQISREFSKDRASKIVKPGEAIVVDGAPHKVQKITQGKRGKGGGYVR